MGRRRVLGAIGAAAILPALGGEALGAPAALASGEEVPLLPDLPIIDPHHHLRDARDSADPRPRYRAEAFLADVARSGHRIVDTVFIECSIMYRPDGPVEQRSLGETAYVAAEAARMAAQGHRMASGIVGRVDLRQGERVPELLAMHAQASGGRLRGIRNSIAWDNWPPLAGMGLDPHLLEDRAFCTGFAALAPAGLVFDVWLFHPQMGAVRDLARAFPDTTIVVNHLACPLEMGPYAGQREAVFAAWRAGMTDLAACPNVVMKLGGLGPFWARAEGAPQPGSQELAAQWRLWIETGIDLFGPHRAMFESNYPANAPVSGYGRIWNAFKRITAGASQAETAALYSQTARRVYGLG